MKKFHDALKTIYGPKSSGATPLLSADGSTLLTDKDAILKKWAEHFNSVLNCPSSVNDNAINRLPQIECNVLLDEFPIDQRVNVYGLSCVSNKLLRCWDRYKVICDLIHHQNFTVYAAFV